MMLKDKIAADLKTAMKSRDAALLSTLRLAASAIHNKEIASRVADLDDDEVLAVLVAEARKRKEAVTEYEKGGRAELAKKEAAELAILQRYLPAQLSESEIRAAVKDVIAKTGASGPKDTGKVMGVAMKTLKNQADGNVVRKIVEEELTRGEA